MKNSFLLVCFTLSGFLLNAQDTIRISSLGIAPGSRINTVSYINKALSLCKNDKPTVILFDKGRYDFWQQYCAERNYYMSNTTIVNPRICPILVLNKKNITIDAAGAEFIFHGKMQPFTVDSSENVTIKNVTVDWEIPFGAEAEIMEVMPAYFDLKFDTKQFHYLIEKDKLYFIGEGWKEMWGGVKWNDPMEFDRESLEVTAATDDDLLGSDWELKYKAEELKEGLVRIHYNNNSLLKKSNYLLLRLSVRDHAGVFIKDSKNILLENINMYSNSGLNFLAQYSQNISCKKINCIPPPQRKVLAGHDDGLHFANCRGLVIIDSCSFRGIMDDAVNFHNTYVTVEEKINDKTLRCRFRHHQSLGFTWARPGEVVGLIKARTMQTIAKYKVSVYKYIAPDVFEISFDNPIPAVISKEDALENLDWNPDTEIRNCYFGQHRARGILVSTRGKVLIENNVFETSGAAICVPGDANHWYEGGAVKDVTIRNNIFKESCNTSAYQFSEGIITVYPGIPSLDLSLPAYHSNINISGNTFNLFDYPLLYVINTDGIRFNNNIINRSTKYTARNDKAALLTFDASRNVEVSGNKITADVLSKQIRLLRMGKKDVKLGKGQIIVFEKTK